MKTDRRDAELLARLLRLGELVAVRVPEPHEEAGRDLVRGREDARGELMRARHRLSKLLLRHGVVYDASAWTLAHDAWLRRQQFDSRPLQLALDESYAAMLQNPSGKGASSHASQPGRMIVGPDALPRLALVYRVLLRDRRSLQAIVHRSG